MIRQPGIPLLQPCVRVCRSGGTERSHADGFIRTEQHRTSNWPVEQVFPLLPSGHPDLILMYLLRQRGQLFFADFHVYI